MTHSLNLFAEIKRKLIHISITVIPLMYLYLFSREQILIISVFLTAGFLFADVLRIFSNRAGKYFLLIFSGLLRADETGRKITGATWLFTGITLTIALFPKEVAIPAILIVTLADPVAALTGKTFGSRRILNKTVEGSVGFFLTALLILLIYHSYNWMAPVTAFILTLVELFPLGLNDNLALPMITAILLTFLS
ncbi:MAG: diacylglycerol/polyprenol kinase family protein [Calditrichaceae bacterium]